MQILSYIDVLYASEIVGWHDGSVNGNIAPLGFKDSNAGMTSLIVSSLSAGSFRRRLDGHRAELF